MLYWYPFTASASQVHNKLSSETSLLVNQFLYSVVGGCTYIPDLYSEQGKSAKLSQNIFHFRVGLTRESLLIVKMSG